MDFKKIWEEHPLAVIVIGIIIIVLLFNSCSDDNSSNLSGYSRYKVSVNVEIEKYDRLGREIDYYFTVNGYSISSGDIIPASGQLECHARIVERDSYYYPDVGMNSVTIDTSSRNKAIVFVTVYEYGGISNEGASATFRVIFTFTGVN